MKSRPILFKGEMVMSILDGVKTQTRRIMNPQPSEDWTPDHYCEIHGRDKHGELSPDIVKGYGACNADGDEGYVCRLGGPGDQLWVRETWLPHSDKPGDICYRATQTDPELFGQMHGGWKPSIHMPRWASRITLEIMDVRVERLNDISEADTYAEGIQPDGSIAMIDLPNGNRCHGLAQDCYRSLWESINGPGSWSANPWVWVIEFKRVQA